MPAGRCPRCGLYLDPLSGECPHCARRSISPLRRGVDRRPVDAPAPRASAAPNTRMLLWAIAAGVACVFIWAQTLPKGGEDAGAESASADRAPLPAEELLRALETYPGPGAGPYVGRRVTVSGVVRDPERDSAEVLIHRRADGVGVVCAFAEWALDPRTPLRDGDRVVVDGRCEGYDATTGVRMTECRLASGRRGDKGAMGAP